MGFFGPPDVGAARAQGDVKKLIKGLKYRKDPELQKAAAEALAELGDERAVAPLIKVFLSDSSDIATPRSAARTRSMRIESYASG